MNNYQSRPIEILLVEDSLSDAKAISKVFDRVTTSHCLRIVSDGVAAMEFLLKQGKYRTYPRPDLILLDLHLPRKDGITVLQEIKCDRRFLDIPVVVLTASDSQRDITKCYQHEANCYLTKPSTRQELEQTVQSLSTFWLQMVELPMIQN